jgi:hypothetical protein
MRATETIIGDGGGGCVEGWPDIEGLPTGISPVKDDCAPEGWGGNG